MKNIFISMKKKFSKTTLVNKKETTPIDQSKKVDEAAQYVASRVKHALVRLSER